MKLFYDVPTQVKFLNINEEDNSWLGGIAYGEIIICMCCGGVINIEEYLGDGGEIIELEWIDLNEEVVGDD